MSAWRGKAVRQSGGRLARGKRESRSSARPLYAHRGLECRNRLDAQARPSIADARMPANVAPVDRRAAGEAGRGHALAQLLVRDVVDSKRSARCPRGFGTRMGWIRAY